MPRALRVCPQPGCPELTRGGRCPTHKAQAEARRGTARQRGYGREHEQVFRPGVLAKDPVCVCPPDHPAHTGKPCLEWSTDADHHPRSRPELVAAGEDPNDPRFGRGLCHPCHGYRTATTQGQAGGWNVRLDAFAAGDRRKIINVSAGHSVPKGGGIPPMSVF